MKVLLCLLALVGVCMADQCNKLQRLKVKKQWADVFFGSTGRAAEGIAVFRAIFKLNPDARDYFKRVNVADESSPEFKAHIDRVLSGLDMAISLLDQPEVLEAELAHLNEQHKERRIPASAFALFKKSLMEIAPAAMGKCFDEEAWSECFDVISNGITN
jgi:hypothetical protein